MIEQIHLTECDSTQDILKEQIYNFPQGTTILISTEAQRAGRGRGENKWSDLPGSICLSMNITPNPELSFTALELSVLVTKYFENKGQTLKLKWPNDLWNSDLKKCGGILIQGSGANLFAGIGINLFSDQDQFGGVYESSFRVDKKIISFEIAEFIQKNRITNKKELQKEWLMRCGHLNQFVKITESNDVVEGIFQGIGEYGEALICSDGKTQKVFNGSLRLIV